VSTRKLIVTALICGLAILVAGGIQLVRISHNKPAVPVLDQGEQTVVGGVRATVTNSARDGRGFHVGVELSAPSASTVAITDFTLLVGGKLEQPTNTSTSSAPGCAAPIAVGTAPIRCTLDFRDRDGSATLAFSRAGDQRIWALEPAA
jgi:hypothetical protein